MRVKTQMTPILTNLMSKAFQKADTPLDTDWCQFVKFVSSISSQNFAEPARSICVPNPCEHISLP
ncbi:MAG: hypothetical protein DME90_11030 [Verrucomicrobia bacterium]|nr:MAG: hypothetical protein DME90_11030 [Verrucomicrobiota bacterium]